MPYNFINEHHAEAAALFCIDFRFKDAVIKFLSQELKLKKADIIVLAGASKNFADPKDLANKKTALTQLEISAKLHGIKKIILIDHADCGAYGGLKAFNNDAELEKKAHLKNLKKAQSILSKKFKSIEIILYFANLKNKKIIFEKA
ncbi:MAG: carbonic anhydrase [Patescibacteria group bacterium]|jgi:carbonic anhydrase